MEFFGKFILCSNNEENFIKIDHHETRFWVLKVPILKKEKTEFLETLAKEIPTFLNYLKNRKLSTKHQTRMWFSAKQIETPALKKLVQNNRNRVERELAGILVMIMENHDLEQLDLCPMDALNPISKTRLRTDLTQIRKILKKDWKLENQSNSNHYRRFIIWDDGSTNFQDSKGRYFTIQLLSGAVQISTGIIKKIAKDLVKGTIKGALGTGVEF